ncbi:kinase-like domain-containing protein [Hysterangium stoloniferum]|nr:kinase-like domain-containing protein [Hysterangium stoloniferum]
MPTTPFSFPKALVEWRDCIINFEKGIYPRDAIWQQLESFFLEQGLILWVTSRDYILRPPNDNERCPDPFAYRIGVSDEIDHKPFFALIKNSMCPARTLDDRDVLIKLVAKGNDGLNHLEALRRLAIGSVGSRGDNHTVPVLRIITLEDMTFVIFPLMAPGFTLGWYNQLHETIDAATQLLEGLAFVHSRLVAHRDIGDDNVLINFVNGPRVREGTTGPFRCHFPVRYYLNDFEFAACFTEHSPPSAHLVSGIPIHPRPIEHYGRIPAPEMLSGTPYCPFKCDVWQMGMLFCETFNQISALPSEIKQIYLEMANDNPLSRPTAAIALDRLRMARDRTPLGVLHSSSLEEPVSPELPLLSLPTS